MTQLQFTYEVLQPARTQTARRSDPDTCVREEKFHWSEHRQLALSLLAYAGERGLTDFELAELSHVAQTSIGKRRLELQRFGYVEQTSERRPSPSGSTAIVWRITSKGKGEYYQLTTNQTKGQPTCKA